MIRKKHISKEQYLNDIALVGAQLRTKIEDKKLHIDNIYPVPRGGYFPAIEIAKILNLPLNTGEINKKTLIVDDIVDTGHTIRKLSDSNPVAAIYVSSRSRSIPVAYAGLLTEWVVLPEEEGDGIEENIVRILEYIGENPLRTGLVGTPDRIRRMLSEICRGYDPAQKPKITVFPNGEDGLTYDSMVIDEGTYYSLCEHHMMPFFGKYWFAYIPNPKGKILGISKIGRVVDYCAAKLQVQERLTHEIVDMLAEALGRENPPLGIALVMKGTHLCKSMRGVKKNGIMTSSYLTGEFRNSASTREEFMKFVNSNE